LLGRCADCPAQLDVDVLRALQEWRRAKAEQLAMHPTGVMSVKILEAIAEQLPLDEAALGAIGGLQSFKLQQYGAEVLDIVRSHLGYRSQLGGKNHETAGEK
jgi:DNA helicase-2/ATP-dependent DNA helicase PcrA